MRMYIDECCEPTDTRDYSRTTDPPQIFFPLALRSGCFRDFLILFLNYFSNITLFIFFFKTNTFGRAYTHGAAAWRRWQRGSDQGR